MISPIARYQICQQVAAISPSWDIHAWTELYTEIMSWISIGIYECRYNMHGPYLKRPAQPLSWPSILNLYCLWATCHSWFIATMHASNSVVSTAGCQYCTLAIALHHEFDLRKIFRSYKVYGHKHANKYVYEHMHNVILLVWGLLRLTPTVAGLVEMEICEFQDTELVLTTIICSFALWFL